MRRNEIYEYFLVAESNSRTHYNLIIRCPIPFVTVSQSPTLLALCNNESFCFIRFMLQLIINELLSVRVRELEKATGDESRNVYSKIFNKAHFQRCRRNLYYCHEYVFLEYRCFTRVCNISL